jgi:hypothetical protein
MLSCWTTKHENLRAIPISFGLIFVDCEQPQHNILMPVLTNHAVLPHQLYDEHSQQMLVFCDVLLSIDHNCDLPRHLARQTLDFAIEQYYNVLNKQSKAQV